MPNQHSVQNSSVQRSDSKKRETSHPIDNAVSTPTQSGPANSVDTMIGGGYGQATFYGHAKALGDPRMWLSANRAVRDRFVKGLQRSYGNAYVQRLVNRLADQSLDAETESIISRFGGQPHPDKFISKSESGIEADSLTVRVDTDPYAGPNSTTGQKVQSHKLTDVVKSAGHFETISRVPLNADQEPFDVKLSGDTLHISPELDSPGSGISQLLEKAAEKIAKFTFTEAFSDLDTAQYRVFREGNVRIVEKVIRVQSGNGAEYVAVGKINGFKGDRPNVLSPTNEYPKVLEDWMPRVAHINGLANTPQDAIEGAEALYEEIDTALALSDEAAISPDVLLTYSATHGVLTDWTTAPLGKSNVDFLTMDRTTKSQVTLMLDAVRQRKPIEISAHSRGSIKIDNAVIKAHEILMKENLKRFSDPVYIVQVQEAIDRALEETGNFSVQARSTISIPDLADEVMRESIPSLAARLTSDQMDRFITIVYSGNAVQFPTSLLPTKSVVADFDYITLPFGKFFERELPTNMDMMEVDGFHNFIKHYADPVGLIIAESIVSTNRFNKSSKE